MIVRDEHIEQKVKKSFSVQMSYKYKVSSSYNILSSTGKISGLFGIQIFHDIL